MVPSTPPPPLNPLEAQLREVFARVVYTHKTHEKCADILQRRYGSIVFWQILLSAVTTGSLLLALFGDQKAGTIVGAVLSTALLALNTYTKDKNLNALVEQHSTTARNLLAIREAYLSLLTDFVSGSVTEQEARKRRDELEIKLQEVNRSAPRTNAVAYRSAQESLKKNEDLTFSDDEINAFLPGPLKRDSLRSDQPTDNKA